MEKIQNINNYRTRLIYCNDYYMEIEISNTRNTLSWNNLFTNLCMITPKKLID